MPLSFPPQLTGDNTRDILALQSYLYDLVQQFDNAAGSAIDPTQGQGGAGALTIDSAPTDVTYTPSVSLSRDGTQFANIDISFTLPDRAVAALVYYRETGTDNWHISFAGTSPYSLQSLKHGVQYDLKLTGQAANGNIGPFSTETTVNIPLLSMLRNIGMVSFPESDEQFEAPMFVPGPPGARGPIGFQGPQGLDAEDVEIPYTMPGNQGLQGIPGPQGSPGLDGIDGEELWLVLTSSISIIP